jgi:hypothetical protein
LLFWPAAGAANSTRVPVADGAEAIDSLAFGVGDQLLVVGTSLRTTLWRVSDWQGLASFDHETPALAGGQPFSPDGHWLVTASPEADQLRTDGGELRVRAVSGGR